MEDEDVAQENEQWDHTPNWVRVVLLLIACIVIFSFFAWCGYEMARR